MLFALDYFEQNINGNIFYDWCKYTLIASSKTPCVIVMDDASFHKRVLRLLNRHGHRLLFLPHYSSDLNPIEKKWEQAKLLRQGWMENNLPKLFHDMGCSSFIVDWLYQKVNYLRIFARKYKFVITTSYSDVKIRKIIRILISKAYRKTIHTPSHTFFF